MTDKYRTEKWHYIDNYACCEPECQFSTTEITAIEDHVNRAHVPDIPLPPAQKEEDRRQQDRRQSDAEVEAEVETALETVDNQEVTE